MLRKIRGQKPAMFNFEKLEVWRRSVDFAADVYRVSRTFPVSERFGLTSQMRRAATSVPSNIAEGSARPRSDFAKFLGYAAGSLYEVVTHAAIAKNESMLLADEHYFVSPQREESNATFVPVSAPAIRIWNGSLRTTPSTSDENW